MLQNFIAQEREKSTTQQQQQQQNLPEDGLDIGFD